MPSRKPKTLLTLVIVAIIAAGVWYAVRAYSQREPDNRYRTDAVERGDIVQTVTANGTINPVTLVNVGTQVSGRIQKLFVDFNSRVEKGQVLAELDPKLLQAQVDQDKAKLASAQATLKLQQDNFTRAKALYGKEYISRADYDTARQTLAVAKADVALNQAMLSKDQTNLSYTVIRSPVSGVVVSRQVDVGQTVAASFQTPTLFQIAKDLKEMQIDTSVAEADVGGIHVGQHVNFYVDAFPNRQFVGKVKQIRINPTVAQNVVTYDVVVSVDNEDEKLLPGMTAYASIIINRRDNIVRIPNAALRFKPKGAARATATAEKKGKGQNHATGAGWTVVYRLGNRQLQPVSVRTGITDNRHTEILEGPLQPGDELVIGLNNTASGSKRGFRFRMF